MENLTSEEIKKYLEKFKDWQISPNEKKIFRSFEFKTFREAMDFVNALADFAEKNEHYPDIIIRFPKVTVELSSQSGLSEQDFILAEEADNIAGWKIKFQKWLASPKVIAVLLVILVLVLLWQRFH